MNMFKAAGLAVMLVALSTRAFAEGTDVFHFTDVTFMTNSTGIVPGADGFVGLTENIQGHAEHQSLTVAVSGLETNTAYELLARVGTNTTLTDAGTVMTGRHGGAIVTFADFGLGRGDDQADNEGRHKHSLPLSAELKPVITISEVDLVNSNAQLVLTADVSDPDRVDYLVQERLKNGAVRGDLLIHASEHHTQFRLQATGLSTNAPYLLAFNGEIVQTNTSTMKGRLDIRSLTETPPFILDVNSVALWDASSNVVLQTTLP